MIARFTPAYILANFGAHVAFLPLLVLLLPRRVEAVADTNPVVLLSWLLLAGGITASLAHILAGAFSDRWLARRGNRREPIAIGLVLLLAAYMLFAGARTPVHLGAAIVAFQFSLNIMFAPLGALLADHIPHERKGWVAGWLNMALPLAGLVVTALGLLSDTDVTWPFYVLALLIALCVLPLLASWPDTLALIEKKDEEVVARPALPRDFTLAWIARLAIQSGAAVIISYLYLYVDAIARGTAGFPDQSTSAGVATLSLIATLVALGAGILAGRWSDRAGRRKLPLVATALGASLALLLLALAPDWRLVLTGYALFTASLTAFLSVDSAMVAQLLTGHKRRGTMLGVMNLTNTLPAVIAPTSALLLSTVSFGGETLRGLLTIAAGAAIVAAVAVSAIRSVR